MQLRHLALTTLACLAGTALATAQIAYPDDSPTTSQGNLVPFGYSGSSQNFDEGRYQLLIPARYLPPTGGLIQGLAVAQPAGPTSITYASLDITLSPINAARLSSTFANNLPAPQVVFSGTDVTLPFVSQSWSPEIQFTQPFLYDGRSDLVIEIRKVIDRNRHPVGSIATHTTSGNTDRTDIIPSIYSFSPFGQGGASATTARTAASPLKVRLGIAPLPTLSLRSDRGGANSNIFAIGGSMSVRIAGTPGTQFAHVLGYGFLLGPTPVPPLSGALWLDLSAAASTGSGTIGSSGEDVTTFPIPNDPGLIGLQIVLQGVSINAGGTVSFTNACDAVIND